MVLTLNNLAEKYGCLPSQALSNGTTLDLFVLDVSTKWYHYQKGLEAGAPPETVPRPNTEELKAMLKRVRNEK